MQPIQIIQWKPRKTYSKPVQLPGQKPGQKPGKNPVKNLVKTGRGYISYLNDPVIYPVVNRVNDHVF